MGRKDLLFDQFEAIPNPPCCQPVLLVLRTTIPCPSVPAPPRQGVVVIATAIAIEIVGLIESRYRRQKSID
jgi:hypothetical protein